MNAQFDLTLRWAHMFKDTFPDIAAHIGIWSSTAMKDVVLHGYIYSTVI